MPKIGSNPDISSKIVGMVECQNSKICASCCTSVGSNADVFAECVVCLLCVDVCDKQNAVNHSILNLAMCSINITPFRTFVLQRVAGI